MKELVHTPNGGRKTKDSKFASEFEMNYKDVKKAQGIKYIDIDIYDTSREMTTTYANESEDSISSEEDENRPPSH